MQPQQMPGVEKSGLAGPVPLRELTGGLPPLQRCFLQPSAVNALSIDHPPV